MEEKLLGSTASGIAHREAAERDAVDREAAGWDAVDRHMMDRAVRRAWQGRIVAPPNPWVGAVLATSSGVAYEGSTRRPGGPHAEIVALRHAGSAARGATLWVTLEPCNHHGRTGPCTEAIIAAGVSRVVVAVEDPDPQVGGSGIEHLRQAGIEVEVGVGQAEVEAQLEPYLVQRRTGRPYVVLKSAASLDAATAAADGSSQWITGDEARRDAHRLRAESGAIVVGAGTVRADNPALTVRGVSAPDGVAVSQPLRVVLGDAPADVAVQPCLSWNGDLAQLLDELGDKGVLQVMIEGGANVAHSFHQQGLVDRYVMYIAPALMGGSDGLSILNGPGAATIGDIWRGEFVDIKRLGSDLRLDVVATTRPSSD